MRTIPPFGTKAYFDLCDAQRARREAFYSLPDAEQQRIIDQAIKEKFPDGQWNALTLLRSAAQAMQEKLGADGQIYSDADPGL